MLLAGASWAEQQSPTAPVCFFRNSQLQRSEICLARHVGLQKNESNLQVCPFRYKFQLQGGLLEYAQTKKKQRISDHTK